LSRACIIKGKRGKGTGRASSKYLPYLTSGDGLRKENKNEGGERRCIKKKSGKGGENLKEKRKGFHKTLL